MKLENIARSRGSPRLAQDNFDIATQPRQHPHETFDGNIAELATRQPRDVGLAETHPFGGFGLGQALVGDDFADASDEPDLERCVSGSA